MSRYDELLSEVEASPSGPQIAAFFDFDGTLIDGYSAMAFYQHRLKTFDVGAAELASVVTLGLRGNMTVEQFAELAGKSLRSWAGRPWDELEELGERLFRSDIAGNIYPETRELLKAHQRKGHTVVLASSATRFQLQPLAREFGVDNVICTEVELEDDLITGRLTGLIPWRDGKAAGVKEFAAAHDLDLDLAFGYANGDEDIPFLSSVGHPCAVNPQGELAKHAAAKGWPVRTFAGRGNAGPIGIARTVGMYSGMAAGFATSLGIGLLNRDRRQAVNMGFSLSSDLGLALAGVKVNVVNEDILWAHRPCVFIFNHQSNLDALIVGKVLRRDFGGVAKKEAANVPGVGQFLQLADTAFIDRGNTAQAKEALAPAIERLKGGLSLALAPEGTRSNTTTMGRFKKGAFHMAMDAGVPIVPFVIRNAADLMWRSSRSVRSGTIDVFVLPPVSVTDWKVSEMDTRIAEVEKQFRDTLADWPRA